MPLRCALRSAEAEDLINERLLREADLEDSDADSDLDDDDDDAAASPSAHGGGGGGGAEGGGAGARGAGGRSGGSEMASKDMEIGYASGGEGGMEGRVELEDMGEALTRAQAGTGKGGGMGGGGGEVDLLGSLKEGDGDADGDADGGGGGRAGGEDELRPAMVTPLQRKALTKEGYKIIGTHSAVKLCRWTKHQLRGRGGCYKHTFYGKHVAHE